MFAIDELVYTFFFVFLLSWFSYYQFRFTYWRRRGVPSISPCFPAGNISRSIIAGENLFVTVQKLHQKFKSQGHKHGGLYFFKGPVYLAVDPELIKHVMTTNFDHFVDRGVYINEGKFPLSGHLFALTGSRWKDIRSKLTPTFSSGKLKSMYEIFLKTTAEFVKTVEPFAERGDDINIKFVAMNFTADIIAATALGLEINTLENPENEVSKIIYQAFQPPMWLFLKTLLSEGLENPGNVFKAMLSNKPVADFFINLTKDSIRLRKDTDTVRKDFLSMLLDIKEKGELSFKEVAAQCFLFVLASFETSSQTIACCIHSLAHYPEVQEKLREEIFQNMGKDFRKFSYEDVVKLPYLDNVFHETLRLHPVVGAIHRICVKPYQVPGTDVVIEEGIPVMISTLGLQRDPDFFPDPLKFDPGRFNGVQEITPFTFLPFGEGPRQCIGTRYGKLQTKLGIASLISQFRFSPSPKTPKHIQYDGLSTSPAMGPRKGIVVKVNRL